MKAMRNDRASYKTRAVIGSPKPLTPSSGAGVGRQDFVVDRNGYFIWPKSLTTDSRKGRK